MTENFIKNVVAAMQDVVTTAMILWNLTIRDILYKEFMLKSTPNGVLFIMHFF